MSTACTAPASCGSSSSSERFALTTLVPGCHCAAGRSFCPEDLSAGSGPPPRPRQLGPTGGAVRPSMRSPAPRRVAPRTTQCAAEPYTPGSHQPPEAQGQCTRSGAVHPIRGSAPDQGQCTRTEEVHCLRIGCSAPTHKNKRGTDRTHPLPATTSPGTGRRAGNDDPVSADSGPSPRPRWLQYRSASPVRRCGRPQFRRPAPCRSPSRRSESGPHRAR